MFVVVASLLIIGYLALGALLELVMRDLTTGLGLPGLVVSPAFGYVGVGFPLLGMNAFALSWGAILPLRWYMAILLGQAARGLPIADSARPFAVLAALTALYSLLAIFRLRAVGPGMAARAAAAEPTPVARAQVSMHGIGGDFAAQMQRVLPTRGAFIPFGLAPLIYGRYYPPPDPTPILRKIPIPVVANDTAG